MNTSIATSIQLGTLLGPVMPSTLPAVIDPATVTQSVARAFDLGVTLGRRFEIVLTGNGRRIDELPRVALARTVRVGDGTLEGALRNMAKRAVLFATPASIALATAFGAAEVSDLALVIAAVAPFTWVPAAAVRSLRAERAANRDIARAASTHASPADLAPIDSFVREAASSQDPRVTAVARNVIDAWIDIARDEDSITPSAESHLAALRDAIPEPPVDVAEQARRLVGLGALMRALVAEQAITGSHVEIFRQALAALPQVEREAVAPALRRLLASPSHDSLRALLPEASPTSRPRAPLLVKILADGATK